MKVVPTIPVFLEDGSKYGGDQFKLLDDEGKFYALFNIREKAELVKSLLESKPKDQ